MCEILAMKSERPFSLLDVIPYAQILEKYGLAGWGWGISWLTSSGIETYKSLGKIEQIDETTAEQLDALTTTCLFHLRRPSLFSSVSLENTQPFADRHKLAFAHNGFFQEAEQYREEVARDLHGTVDSEIGFQLYLRNAAVMDPLRALTETVTETIGTGEANVVVLREDGSFHALGHNPLNRMFQFSSEQFSGIVTEVYSADGYVFDHLLPWMDPVEQITDAVVFH